MKNWTMLVLAWPIFQDKNLMRDHWVPNQTSLRVYLMVSILLSITTVPPVIIGVYLGRPPYLGNGCLPDRSFSFSAASHTTINEWSNQNLFGLSVAFGDLSFSMAKFIDLCWDLVVGHDGQAILAVTSYSLFKDPSYNLWRYHQCDTTYLLLSRCSRYL
jgi:hypothetical protein